MRPTNGDVRTKRGPGARFLGVAVHGFGLWWVCTQARADCRSRRSALVTIDVQDEHRESLRALVEDYFAQNPDWQKLQVRD